MIRAARGLSLASLLLTTAALGGSCGEQVLLGSDPAPAPPMPPCQDKLCGEGCMLPPCPDGGGGMCDPQANGACNAEHQCVPLPMMDACPNPCADAGCNDACMLCPPGEPDCMPGQCDGMHTCVQGMVQCPPPDPCLGGHPPCTVVCSAVCDPMMQDGGCPPRRYCDPLGNCVLGPPMCAP